MQFKPVEAEAEWEGAQAVRQRVFVEEQACPPEEEWDAHDATSRHLVGCTAEGTIAATARWRAVTHHGAVMAKLERFAVLPAHRSEGHGRALVRYALADARRAGFSAFVLHAQAHLEAFYATFGFASTGRRFQEAGIPHVEMVMHDE
jgi:predicted GNAT family N-acyltransferase